MQEDPIGNNGGSLNWYLYVKNNPVNYKDPTGLAYFAKRPLAVLGGIWIPIGSCNPLDDLLNTELSHEQLFFEDGKQPSNIGFGPNGPIPNEDNPNIYRCKSRKYNDCIMRKAVEKTPMVLPWTPIGNNCQSWAEQVRRMYRQLSNNPEINKECCNNK